MKKLHEQILHEVTHNPFRLVNAEELAECIRKSINFVLAAKNAGAPFPGGVTRPEWFLEWLRANPDFCVKEHDHRTAKLKLRKAA